MSAGQAKRSPTQPQRVEKGRDCTSMPCIDNNVAPNRDSLSVRQRALIAPAARARSDVHKNDDNDDQPDARAFRLASAPAGLLGRLAPNLGLPPGPVHAAGVVATCFVSSPNAATASARASASTTKPVDLAHVCTA